MGICDSTMGLSRTLLVMALLLSGVSSMKSQAYFNKTGELPCHFTNSQNISLDELVVFWQDQDKLVLYELFRGKENPQNVHLKYKGRTSFDKDNWTLRLHNVQIKDKGTYHCFIHYKGPKGLVPMHQMSSDLSVLANFSQPEITVTSNRTENSGIINLTCSSIQGYPEPKEMYFQLNTENSTTKYDTVMKKSQNNVTELYNVSISLPFSVPEAHNVSVFCALKLETLEMLLSLPFNIDAQPKDKDPEQGHFLWIAAVLVMFVVFCGMVSFKTLRKRKKKQPGPSHECETIKGERKESKQTNERVPYHVPERSDEAQCVNILKTASGDKSTTHF
ncbi:T-lymphocyte activation antigen CD86 isoform X1 [Panthera onca]|uniref:T-lymphocyte activation antigen CD86 isoform X1 n=1 Tax=Panthera leo TaxID=9689 RepID=UPI001C6A4915|nr:T-lymphocyte activation antigen CD86 isoform X1 [Panthera leo]XP_049484232.1 T-lymphocyte activation antigen CD86 isoform X3 [Panthera uncia]XP_060495794.1 T-lymphocyte activation antigen CD86 isoform X1 [Panthera onca]